MSPGLCLNAVGCGIGFEEGFCACACLGGCWIFLAGHEKTIAATIRRLGGGGQTLNPKPRTFIPYRRGWPTRSSCPKGPCSNMVYAWALQCLGF